MGLFTPVKKHANKFRYIPRYYDPEKERREQRRKELCGVSSDDDGEYTPGKYIRTQREARKAAEDELLKRLKEDVDPLSIKTLFVTAAAMIACSMNETYGGVKSWSAGQVAVTEGGAVSNLRDRAEILMAGYIDAGSGFDFVGVDG